MPLGPPTPMPIIGPPIIELMYSVTHSHANSFLGDVVLDTINDQSWDEDSILDQIYIKQICPDLYCDNF